MNLLVCWCISVGLKVKVHCYWFSKARGVFQSKQVEGCVCLRDQSTSDTNFCTKRGQKGKYALIFTHSSN